MSETQAETTQPIEQSEQEQTFPIRLVKQETGRTHTVVTNGVQQTVPLVHGETGEPETEYVLLATIDGADVVLASYNSGRIESQAAAARQRQQTTQQV